MDPELTRTRQHLIFALREFIPRCKFIFNIFEQELDRLVFKYTGNITFDNQNDDINMLYKIKNSLNDITNTDASLDKYICGCENVIRNNTNLQLLKELKYFVTMDSALLLHHGFN